MAGTFCDQCTDGVEELRAELREQSETLAKSEKVRGQLRLAADHLQKKLASTKQKLQKQEEIPPVPSLSSSASPEARDSTGCSEDKTAQDLALALSSELSAERSEKERIRKEADEALRKLREAEAKVEEYFKELESVKATRIPPEVLQRAEEELAALKAKEEARPADPLDALDALQRDLESAASFRRAAFTDTHRNQQLVLQTAELEEQCKTLKTQNADLKARCKQLEEEAEDLGKACVDSSNDMVRRYDDMHMQLKLLRDGQQTSHMRLSILDRENAELRAIHDEGKVQRVEDELKTLTTEIQRLRSCNAALCSQLFENGEKGHGGSDEDASMLLQGQRPMDMVDIEADSQDVHIRTIVRLQQKLTDANERHMIENEKLMEKLQQMERQNAARVMQQEEGLQQRGGAGGRGTPPMANESNEHNNTHRIGARSPPEGVSAASSSFLPASSRFLPASFVSSVPSMPKMKATWSSFMSG